MGTSGQVIRKNLTTSDCPINIGVVGGGKMGLSHLAILNAQKDVNIVAILERSLALRLAYRRLGFPVVSSVAALRRSVSRLDAVVISTPNSSHYSLANEFLDSGVSVFIEKPMTSDAKDSARLVERVDHQGGVVAQVGYVNRFISTFMRSKEIIASKRFGRVLSYENKMFGCVVTPETDAGGSWRFDSQRGGGCLRDYGPHSIDLGLYHFGEYVSVENAQLHRIHSQKCDDEVLARVKHGGDITGELHFNWCNSEYRKASNQMVVNLEHAKITVDKQFLEVDCDRSIPEFALKPGINRFWTTDFNQDVPFYLRGEEFTRQLAEFCEKVRRRHITGVCCGGIGATFSEAANVDWTIEEIERAGQ